MPSSSEPAPIQQSNAFLDDSPLDVQSDEKVQETIKPKKLIGKKRRNKRDQVSRPQYEFLPENNLFVGSVEDMDPTTFQFHLFPEVERSLATACESCLDENCEERCRVHNKAAEYLNKTALQAKDARLHVIAMDPIAWLWEAGEGIEKNKLLESFVDSVKSDYCYRTFKGSDHVFICLTDGCLTFGQRLASTLAGDLGTRAIFAGVDVDKESLKWSCPLRAISLDRSEMEDMESAMHKILKTATLMIEKRNRWICSDRIHPANHWDGLIGKDKTAGAYMRECTHSFVNWILPLSFVGLDFQCVQFPSVEAP